MIYNIITLLALLAISALVLKMRAPSSKELWMNEAHQYSFEGIYDYVKASVQERTRTNLEGMGLSKEAYQRELYKRSELITSLRRCVFGSTKDKQFVKDVIYDILANSFLDEDKIDAIIPFGSPSRMSTTDRFDILLYYYKKQHGSQALNQLINKYQLDSAKGQEQTLRYEIDEDDINQIFAQEGILLNYPDKLSILTQRVYQRYKGFSVIDELRDMQIDGISGGVSGLVDNTENLETLMSQFKKVPYNYDSIWLFYQGKSIHLSFLSFGSINELRRVCQNIYRYNNSGMLSQSKGFKVNDMIDGSRVVVVRPDFSESWAFFIRKFNLSHTKLEKLIADDNAQLPIEMIKYLAKGGRITAITGSQGSGKTTLLMAMVEAIYGTLTLRIQEMAFELHLRKLYPTRNILSFKETQHISGQAGLDVQKKTDGSVNILGEVATDEVAAWMIQMAQVASLFTIFTHHAKTTRDLVLSLRNSLLKCDVFRNEEIAEEQVVNVVNFDIHLNRDFNGKRYVERITEIIPIEQVDDYPTAFSDKSGDDMQQAFMHTMTHYFRRMTDKNKYQTRDILRFDGTRYQTFAPISNVQIMAMSAQMLPSDAAAFKAFIADNWEEASDASTIA